MLGTLNPSQIQTVLCDNTVARLACRNGNNIYIVPVTYQFEDGNLLCHSFEGQKVEWMRRNEKVGLEVEAIDDYRNWKCITGQGVFEEITDKDEIIAAASRLSNMALTKKASLTALPPAEVGPDQHLTPRISVFYRIRIINVSGRFERNIFE